MLMSTDLHGKEFGKANDGERERSNNVANRNRILFNLSGADLITFSPALSLLPLHLLLFYSGVFLALFLGR